MQLGYSAVSTYYGINSGRITSQQLDGIVQNYLELLSSLAVEVTSLFVYFASKEQQK
jgi:hypothetical protein